MADKFSDFELLREGLEYLDSITDADEEIGMEVSESISQFDRCGFGEGEVSAI